MLRLLAHRGPDGNGSHYGSHAALGHTRLSLLDHAHGAQPWISPDGRYVMTYNGEIYSFEGELAWPLRTRCDAELLLAAYARHGLSAIAHLNGMFAFAIWDEQLKQGVLVRDRLGIKPLAYRWDGRELTFASEAGALVREQEKATANPGALLEYLVAPCFSGVRSSMFDSVHYLEPGGVLRVDRSGISLERWLPQHAPQSAARARSGHAAELASRVREALPRAVERCRRADAAVGTFLSGGLDSSIIAALSPELPTLSARFEGHADFDQAASRMVVSDDVPWVLELAQSLRIDPHWVDIEAGSLAALLALVAATDDALPAWEQELTQHQLFARAKALGLKAVLVGDAADETHHGYHFLLDDEATSGPEALIERFTGVPIARELSSAPVAELGAQYRALLSQRGLGYGSKVERLEATSALIRALFLPRLLHNGDILGMAHGVEGRVPFADLDLLAAADEVPIQDALAGGVEKVVLREAARGWLPDRLRLRRKSALPRPPRTRQLYEREARRVLRDPHPVVAACVDLPMFERRLAGVWDERQSSAIFRVIALSAWCSAFDVRWP